MSDSEHTDRTPPPERAAAKHSEKSRLGGITRVISGEHYPERAGRPERAIEMLLREGLVSAEQVRVALKRSSGSAGRARWRALAEEADVDRAAVFAAVAKAAGIERATVSAERPTASLVQTVRDLLPGTLCSDLLAAGVLPFEMHMDAEAQRLTLVFATHDPTHPDVAARVDALPLPTELRFAPEAAVAARTAVLRSEAEERAAKDQDAEGSVPLASAPPSEASASAEAGALREAAPPSGNGPDAFPLGTLAPPGGEAIRNRIEELGGDVLRPPASDELPASVDGHSVDLAGAPPVANVANWVPRRPGDASGDVGGDAPDRMPPAASSNASPSEALIDAVRSKDRVVDLLLRGEIVTPRQVRAALRRQEQEGVRQTLWRVLAAGDDVDRAPIFAEAARIYAFPLADLAGYPADAAFTKSVMDTFAEHHRDELLQLGVVPYRANRDRTRGTITLFFITHDPTRPDAHRLLRALNLDRFELQYAPESVVGQVVAEAFPRKNEYLERLDREGGGVDLGASYEQEDTLVDEDALEAEISRSKLINLFEATLVEAVRQGASDIHIYPNAQKQIEIHFRVDGRLKRWHLEDKVHPEALLAVVKDNAINVDRFERDAAQDGFIQRWVDEALIRFRVSVLPIANASQEIRSESIVIRVLDDRKVITNLSQLGLLEGALQRFEQAISQPHGMVILTGPTGSGKSTTLVASLHSVVSPEVNVLTIEDPVEYIIPDVRQIKLNNKLNLSQALRSILRHDPDVVMVGEMRDRATAELAIKLANTGHLTFSTLHTNDAPSAISRLYKMGIEPFLIAYAINLVVAQRLIRKVCPDCKQRDPDPDPVLLQKLGFSAAEIAETDFYVEGNDRDCSTCNGFGYKGRRAISEALYFSRAIRHMIVEADKMIDEGAIRDLATSEGMLTLRDSARQVVLMGETSVREMMRVVTTDTG